jgi:hypothetical protein
MARVSHLSLPRRAFHFSICALLFSLSTVFAAVPFDSAKVTLIENQVSVGEVRRGQTVQRAANVADTVGAKEFVLTASQSRAELTFKDNTIVRVGQNSIFSFDAGSRTLSLQKGAMLFYVPPGSGGGTIKTPTLTAAIAGTICKVSTNMIAVLDGKLFTKWGVVLAGYALVWKDGKVRIIKFRRSDATTGKLYSFGGPLPQIPEIIADTTGIVAEMPPPDLRLLDVLEATQINPRVNFQPGDATEPTPPVRPPPPDDSDDTQPVEQPPYF